LKLVAVAATGTDNVDLAACRERGIAVCNIRDYSVVSVPEHCFALMLAVRRNLMAYAADVAAGRWEQSTRFCLLDHPIARPGRQPPRHRRLWRAGAARGTDRARLRHGDRGGVALASQAMRTM
jgi:hypothetical protein